MTTQDRVRIFDRQGKHRAEFRANVQRSWVIGAEGRAAFTLSSLDTRNVDIDVINPGNWLYVQNSSLQDWIGVIDFPREWAARKVTVHAYTPERLLRWRRGPIQQVLNGPAGAIFEQYIAWVNQAEPTILQPGNIWKDGRTQTDTVNPVKLDTKLRALYVSSGQEYTWRADTDQFGRLIVYADWVQRLGTNTNLLLQEGKGGGNIEATAQPMIESEPVENDILGYGDGLTWLTKPTTQKRDIDSIHKYGLREGTKEFRGVTVPATLSDKTQSVLDNISNPLHTFDVVGLDKNGALVFPWLRQGNRVNLRMQSVGFVNGGIGVDTSCRILGMGFNPADGNRVPLILREYLNG